MYKFLEIEIKPETAFGTPLKGDTIFGHFMWQIVYEPSLIKTSLEEVVFSYEKEPFAVFSSACYKNEEGWYFKRPSLPQHFFEKEEGDCFKTLSTRKEQKKKKFIKVDKDLKIVIKEYNLVNLANVSKTHRRVRNSISRVSFTTGENFAPYEVEEVWFYEDVRLSVFCLYLEEVIEAEAIVKAFERIGKVGFGKDASLGLGKFKVMGITDLEIPKLEKYVYTLSPCLPDEKEVKDGWFLPFIRFGKHGGEFAISKNPFKEPVIMADEGAVFILKENKNVPILGRGIKGGSKVCKDNLIQGYTIILPVRFARDEGV